METLSIKTDRPEFDRYLDWLKYQRWPERIWARRGFYQASGAFGFRDQLPGFREPDLDGPVGGASADSLARLAAVHRGGRRPLVHLLQRRPHRIRRRTHASDNLLWLAWGVVDYVGATGDVSILQERTPYLESEQPFEPLPAGKGGSGSTRSGRRATTPCTGTA